MNKLKDKQEYLQNENLDMENIVKEYTSFLNSIINNKVNNTLSLEDKEEILTDAFFILWKNQEKVTSIKTYLVGVVNNLIKEKFKKNKITYDFDEVKNCIDVLNNNLFEDSSRFEKIEEIIGELNEEDRKIIRLFYYEDKSIKEISKEMNQSLSNIKIRLFRIRKTIKKKLKVGDK